MGTEETELTFVRCPSCRSLIPAVATRCRMCGFVLKDSEDSESAVDSNGESSAKKSRVRQRSVSLSKNELDELKSDLGLDAEKSAEEPAQESPPRLNRSLDYVLGQGQPEEEKSPSQDAGAISSEDPSSEQRRGSGALSRSIIDRIIENSEEDGAEEEAPPFQVKKEDQNPEQKSHPVQKEEPFRVSPEHAQVVVDPTSPPSEEELSKSASEESEKDERRKRKRRRSRRRKKRSAESLEGSSPENDEFEDEDDEDSFERDEQPQKAVEPVVPQEEEVEAVAELEQSQKDETVTTKPEAVNREDKEMEQSGLRSKTQVRKNQRGDLIGWFVSFEKDHGEATEIRAGRFFVGSERVKDTDLVIDENSISTPHCLISANREGGMRIQDLMSEQGTFVRKSGKKNFVQCSEAVELEHGDFLKLGQYEVMVCIVPVTAQGNGHDSDGED